VHTIHTKQALNGHNKENIRVLDLVADILDVVYAVFDVSQFSTINKIQVVVTEMNKSMRAAEQLVNDRGERSAIGEAVIGLI
jgi:hypothetical protein